VAAERLTGSGHRRAPADDRLQVGWGRYRNANRAGIMFDVLMNLSVVLSVGFPAVPWIFGARWGSRGVWLSTACAVVILLCCFPVLFSVSCGDCGQGAIAIFVLAPIWIASALLTVTSAAIAHYKFAH
jgi:hypothetical protein